MLPKFQVGDKVTAVSFTNCFGQLIPATPGLTVERVELIEPRTMLPYYRILAASTKTAVAGEERFFAKEAYAQ